MHRSLRYRHMMPDPRSFCEGITRTAARRPHPPRRGYPRWAGAFVAKAEIRCSTGMFVGVDAMKPGLLLSALVVA
jgi:hypothetical protein